MWNFKGSLWNSTQNILPIHWQISYTKATDKKLLNWRAHGHFCNVPLVSQLMFSYGHIQVSYGHIQCNIVAKYGYIMAIITTYYMGCIYILLAFITVCWYQQKLIPTNGAHLGISQINSLDPGRCRTCLKSIIFKLIIENSNLSTHSEIVVRRMLQNLINEK